MPTSPNFMMELFIACLAVSIIIVAIVVAVVALGIFIVKLKHKYFK